MIGKIILAGLILLSLGVFLRRLNQLIKLVKLGQGELTLDSVGAGIKRVLVTAFGQKTVVKEKSGYGHFLIFWGFMFLTFGTVEGLLAGFIDGFSFSFYLNRLPTLYYPSGSPRACLQLLLRLNPRHILYRKHLELSSCCAQL